MKEHPFFAKQRVDPAGHSAVALQKLLIALWIMTIFSVFIATGFGILGILLESILIFIGLYGAVKRRPRWLNFFWIVQLVFLVLYCLFIVLQVIVVATFIAHGFMTNNQIPQQENEGPGIRTHHQAYPTEVTLEQISRAHIVLALIWSVTNFLFALALIYMKARSIVLARHTVKLLKESHTSCATELNLEAGESTIQKETQESQTPPSPPPVTTTVQPAAPSSNGYVMMQPIFIAPGSATPQQQPSTVYYAMPVPTFMNNIQQPFFVDQSGNPTLIQAQQQQQQQQQ